MLAIIKVHTMDFLQNFLNIVPMELAMKLNILIGNFLEKQIAIIIAGTKGHLDDIPIGKVKDFENGLLDYLDANYSSELESIRTEGTISDEAGNKLDEAILAFKGGFTA